MVGFNRQLFAPEIRLIRKQAMISKDDVRGPVWPAMERAGFLIYPSTENPSGRPCRPVAAKVRVAAWPRNRASWPSI